MKQALFLFLILSQIAFPAPPGVEETEHEGGAADATARSEKKPEISVQMVLTEKDLKSLIELMYDLAMTPEGKTLTRGSLTPGATGAQQMAAFEEFLKVVPLGPSPYSAANLTVYYDRAALKRLLKRKLNQYFLGHAVTRFGKNHPEAGRRIRSRWVRRPKSLYNRLTTKAIGGVDEALSSAAEKGERKLAEKSELPIHLRMIPMKGKKEKGNGRIVILKDGVVDEQILLPDLTTLNHGQLVESMQDTVRLMPEFEEDLRLLTEQLRKEKESK